MYYGYDIPQMLPARIISFEFKFEKKYIIFLTIYKCVLRGQAAGGVRVGGLKLILTFFFLLSYSKWIIPDFLRNHNILFLATFAILNLKNIYIYIAHMNFNHASPKINFNFLNLFFQFFIIL